MDKKWMIEDIHQELKAWGHPGGEGSKLIVKSDGESPIVAVREAVSKRHGGLQVFMPEEECSIDLRLKQALMTFKHRAPTDHELGTCKKYTITHDMPWDPRNFTDDPDSFLVRPSTVPTN